MLIFEIHRSAKLWLSNNIQPEVGAGGAKGKCTGLNCILATRSHPLGLVGRRPALVYWWWWWRCWWWHWWRWWTWWQAGWMNQCLFLHTRPDNIGNWWQYFLWWWYKVISYKRTIVVVVVGSPSNTTLRIFPKLEALLMDRSKPVQPQRSQESNQCGCGWWYLRWWCLLGMVGDIYTMASVRASTICNLCSYTGVLKNQKYFMSTADFTQCLYVWGVQNTHC